MQDGKLRYKYQSTEGTITHVAWRYKNSSPDHPVHLLIAEGCTVQEMVRILAMFVFIIP
jgi:hypothetical protein